MHPAQSLLALSRNLDRSRPAMLRGSFFLGALSNVVCVCGNCCKINKGISDHCSVLCLVCQRLLTLDAIASYLWR